MSTSALIAFLLLSCGNRADSLFFLLDRVKGKLLIERSSGLCNNLLIQKLSAVSGSVVQVTGLLQ